MSNKLNIFIFGFFLFFIMPQYCFANIKEVKIYGLVKTKTHNELENVQIQIVEIDNEPAEEKVQKSIIKTDSNGAFLLTIDSRLIKDIEEIISLKLLFKKDGFKRTYLTIGPIIASSSEQKKSVKVLNDIYTEELKVYLNPSEPFPLTLLSLNINSDLCIFEKGSIFKSQSPFVNVPNVSYFHVKRDLEKLKSLADERYTSGSNSIFERVFREVKPLILAISNEALQDNIVKNNSKLKKIFLDKSGIELFKVLIPAGKSFTTKLNKLTDEDIQLRLQVFTLLSKYLQQLDSPNSSNPILKASLLKYGNVFKGFFEPIFTITFQNNGQNKVLLKKIIVDVKSVEVYLGGEEKGRVPIVDTYDIIIKPKQGLYTKDLIPMLQISPAKSEKDPFNIAFNLRFIPDTPYLHSYLIQLKFITDKNHEILSPVFVIDM